MTRPWNRRGGFPAALLITAAIATVIWVNAGSLTPPGGPVSPTMKTLSEVEPRIAINATNTPGDADSLYKITQPGSYYLTGNIQGVAAKHGIEITAGGVTLDLNGFDLLGVAGSLDGVSTTVAGLTNIAVVNGSVRSWGDEGVDLGTLAAINCRVSGLLASGNTGTGILVDNGCTVTNCSAYQNTVSGIIAGSGCTVSNCSAFLNTNSGISAGGGCTVSNCSAYQNITNGISVSSGCRVSNCSSSLNTGSGISTSSGSTVADCTARANALDGILCTSQCIIRGNNCATNGNGGDGAGIHATGSDNRIEGNNCTAADRGIDVDAAGNIIVKNTCSGATIDWVIAADNVFGPIVDRRAPANAAVSGFAAASSLSSTDANANFSY
jgi:hypothetical protein